MQPKTEKNDRALDLARNLLEAGKPAQAADVIRQTGTDTPEHRNAYGVCLMRVGEIAKAIELYRDLVLYPGSVSLKPGTPTRFKTNLATALLLANNVAGCVALLEEIHQEEDPYVRKLRATIDRWRHSLGWWKRFTFDWCGAEPSEPVSLDFLPGELPPKREFRPAA